MELPTSLGKYELLELIGYGGQGKVYRALDTSLQRIVAIKVFFSGKGAGDRQRLAGFIYEARLASALDHPNICTVYSLVEDGEHPYMIMEYVEGKNLFELAYGRPLEIGSAIRIVLQVTEALALAHSLGIIHRDIKPRNVMVTPSGQVRVLDFGLAKLLERSDGSYEIDDEEIGADGSSATDIYDNIAESLYVTPPGVVQGTPSTSAPEMALGKPTDERSDVFSTGVLLYLLLTGKYPFIAKTKKEVLDQVVNTDPVPVSVARATGKPPTLGLIAIVQRALKKDPNDRYQSIAEMREALVSVFGEIDPEEVVPAFDQGGEIFFVARKKRLRKFIILVAIVAAIIGLVSLLIWVGLG